MSEDNEKAASTAVLRKNYGGSRETESILIVGDTVNCMCNPDGSLVIEIVKHGKRNGQGEAIVLRLASTDAPRHRSSFADWLQNSRRN